jgi:NhaP-type Na+/H+ or K+/H+ antiporter
VFSGAPRCVTAVLEGESMINDGTALVVYSAAIEAVLSGSFSWSSAALDFPFSMLGGIGVGLAVAWLISWAFLQRPGSGYHIIVLVLFCAYLTYLSADLLGASGVLAAVAGSIYIGHCAPLDASSTDRITGYSFREIMVFLLNALVFILLGLQFPGMLAGISCLSMATLALWAGATSIAVIGLRVIWSLAFGQIIFRVLLSLRVQYPKPPWRQSLVIGGPACAAPSPWPRR